MPTLSQWIRYYVSHRSDVAQRPAGGSPFAKMQCSPLIDNNNSSLRWAGWVSSRSDFDYHSR